MRATVVPLVRHPSLSLPLSLAAAMVARPAARFGGEWAGWCCTYGSDTGTLCRVDERYLSDTAIEYGQVPAGFEECTTESWEDDALVRRSLRLLPENELKQIYEYNDEAVSSKCEFCGTVYNLSADQIRAELEKPEEDLDEGGAAEP